jgi:hypothetical protein
MSEAENDFYIYFYDKGEYYALRKGRKKAYLPKISISEYNKIKRDDFAKAIYSQLISSCKITFDDFKSNIWTSETVKLNSKKYHIIRIDLNDKLKSYYGLNLKKYIENNDCEIESDSYELFGALIRKHESPVIKGTLLFAITLIFLGIIALFVKKLNSILIDITAFVVIPINELLQLVTRKISNVHKYKLSGIYEVIIAFFSLIISMKFSEIFLNCFTGINTSAFTIIAFGISLLLTVFHYKNKLK